MSEVLTVPYKNNTLGATSWWDVPANLEELVKAFGEEVVYTAAVRQGFYGPTNNAFRKALVKYLEELTGVKREQAVKAGVPQVRTKKDGTELPVLETEQDYIKRIKLNNNISEADYLAAHQHVAKGCAFKIATPEEEGEPDEEFIKGAKQILAMVEAGTVSRRTGQPVTEESFTTSWEAANPGHSLENLGGFTELGIARALEIDDKRRKAEQVNNLI